MSTLARITLAVLLLLILALLLPSCEVGNSDQQSSSASPVTSSPSSVTSKMQVEAAWPTKVGGNHQQLWSGDGVDVAVDTNGEEIDSAGCRVYVNDNEQELLRPAQAVDVSADAGKPVLQFRWKHAYDQPGEYQFRVVVANKEGGTVEASWIFASDGALPKEE